MRRRVGVTIAVAAIVLALVIGRWTRTEDTPAPLTANPGVASASTAHAIGDPRTSATDITRATATDGGTDATAAAADPTRAARKRGARKMVHSIDPCEPVEPSEIPEGFSKLAALGVTVAWDAEVAIEPTSLAYTVAGLLAQLALVTGTTPRGELTVIVYPSLDDFHAKAGAPPWSGGLYDSAIRLPASPRRDFGIDLRTLRHEVVHAQLHAAIGCTPIWLDEGLAQWFENAAPDPEWLRMLHDHKGLGLTAMQVSTLEDVGAERPDQVYAQSLAMVLYAFSRGDTLEQLLHDRRGPPLELWARRYPDANEQDVLGALSRRIFGAPLGPEVDAIFEGAVCCRGAGVLSELACHGGARLAGELCRVVP
jgi:hypothetical protein